MKSDSIDTDRIHPVILCGGAGTRLWPLSQPQRPKQLLALVGRLTMLQTTALRVREGKRFAPPVLIANSAQAEIAAAQLTEAAVEPGLLILEPSAKNTAPAIALAALSAEPADLLLVMPSDHVIGDEAAFLTAVETALPFAKEGWLVTFGIRPDRPETGYGYIRRGDEVGSGVYRADQFVEKPDRLTAESYIAAGCYDWNGGIFLFRADALLDALSTHAPDILHSVQDAVASGSRNGGRLYPDPDSFAAVPARSIDHAVMENAERIAVVPVEMRWSDVGSWDALYEIGQPDPAGNVATGLVTAVDTANCLLRSDGPRLVTVGVEDLIVIATSDAVLVLPRGESQRVKDALAALEGLPKA